MQEQGLRVQMGLQRQESVLGVLPEMQAFGEGDKEMIYLACPYSHPLEGIRLARFRAANIAAARLMAEGHIVYSAISHTHPIAVENNLGLDWDYWRPADVYFIGLCDEMVVLKYPGWEESKGIDAEMRLAKSIGKKIRFMEWTE